MNVIEMERVQSQYEAMITSLQRENSELRQKLLYYEDILAVKSPQNGPQVKRLRNEDLIRFVDHLPIGRRIESIDGVIEWANDCDRNLLGYEVSEYIGKSSCYFHYDKNSLFHSQILERLQRKEVITNEKVELRHKNGSIVCVLVDIIGSYDSCNLLQYLQVYSRDVTPMYGMEMKIRQLEKELQESKDRELSIGAASRQRTNFLANMSHELRTPLNGVTGLSFLLKNTELSATQQDYVNDIDMSAGIMLRLIEDILDFSKIDAGKIELESIPFNVDKLLHDAKKMLTFQADGKNLPILVTYSVPVNDSNCWYMGDPKRICQIILNLCNNAVKFTHQGSVEINLGIDTISTEQNMITISVKDTGVGIANTSKLFAPYTQADASVSRNYGGTGLGLSICRGLVSLMNGKIDIKSKVGEGTTIWFQIPMTKATQRREKTNSMVETMKIFQPINRPVRILIAEDNIVNVKVMKHMLNKLNFDDSCITIAYNGHEAIAAYNHSIESSKPYDMCFMDCFMAEMDGYDATRHIREIEAADQNNRLPVIAVTANAYESDRVMCLEAGMDDFLTKPVSINRLRESLSKWIKNDPQ